MSRPASAKGIGGLRARVLGAVTGAVVMLGVLAGHQLTRRSPPAPVRARAVAAPLLSNAAFERRSGVRIVRVAVSGGGGLVDLRYRVLDPDAAASVHAAGAPPQLVDERTGVLVSGLLMDHSHKGRLHAAQTYYLVFENPGNLVRRGGRVTVQLGPGRVAHVPVR